MTVKFRENMAYGAVLGAGLIADIAWLDSPRPLPAIVSVHGGRWIRGSRLDDGKEGRPNNGVVDLEQWAAAGFFVMRIDYRLVTCTPAPACFQDLACAIRWVHHHALEFNINPAKIFLIGQSAGGHMVSLAATLGADAFPLSGGWEEESSDFAGAISVSGAYDLLTLDWGSGWCPLGVPWDVARAHASPVEHATRQTKPLLIFHAEDDPSVPVSQADVFSAKLREVGAVHVYHRYHTGGHLRITSAVYEESRAFIGKILEETP